MLNNIDLKNIQQNRKILEEAVLSIIKRTKKEKRRALGARTAVNIAKEKNPGLYKRYKKFRDLYLLAKKEIKNKYNARGIIFAKKTIK